MRHWVLAVAILASGWVVSSVAAQYPIFREVASSDIATTLESIEGSMAQDATHGAAVPGTGPLQLTEASSDYSGNTAVSDGNAVRVPSDLLGRPLWVGPCDRGARVGGVTTVTDGSSTSAISAGGAGVYLEVWDVVVANTSASAVTVDIRDGTAGSVLATFPVPADTSGVVYPLQVPLTSSANTAIAVDPSAAASSIIVTLRGCKAK